MRVQKARAYVFEGRFIEAAISHLEASGQLCEYSTPRLA